MTCCLSFIFHFDLVVFLHKIPGKFRKPRKQSLSVSFLWRITEVVFPLLLSSSLSLSLSFKEKRLCVCQGRIQSKIKTTSTVGAYLNIPEKKSCRPPLRRHLSRREKKKKKMRTSDDYFSLISESDESAVKMSRLSLFPNKKRNKTKVRTFLLG